VRRTIRQAGAKLIFLPFNPIEQLFAKLKALLRKAMPRTTDAVCSALAEILGALTPRNAQITSKTQDMRQSKATTL
jgi:transposase